MRELEINIENITRVEGHGNIVVTVREGNIVELRLEITESPRFFEAMVVGRAWSEVQAICCRICGICSIAHSNAALRAVEGALGITPSEQTALLRRLIHYGEVLQSHLLHCYFLAAPDFCGAPSIVPMIETHREVVERGLRLKRLANDICRAVGGRHVHPITMAVNGFTKLPELEELRALRERLEEARGDVQATVEFFAQAELPQFAREDAKFLSLRAEGQYALVEGEIATSDGRRAPVESYQELVREYVVEHSTAKHAGLGSEDVPYAVGALARVNINYDLLHPKAKQAAEALGVAPPCGNPFMNTRAQVVEVVHCVEEAIALLGELERRGLAAEETAVEVRGGRGVGAVEAPRGTLFYDVEVGDDGLVSRANLIIPTNQNLHSIEADMRALVPQILTRGEDEVAHTLEMLVRAYDPCISCATHLVEVHFE